MSIRKAKEPPSESTAAPATVPTAPFGVNAMRLSGRQWLLVAAILLGCCLGIPRLWKRIERFDTGPDYRIPYALSNDYWLFQRRLERITDSAGVPVLGDSVVWGEYVRPDATLSHYLNRETGRADRFLNCGINGLFPLALEGLVDYYAATMRDRPVVVHCNLLWMTSPKADLSTAKEENFNHAGLVPQFSPRIPCYRADTAARLSAVVGRSVGFFGWVTHVETTYFGSQSIPRWTLEQDESQPPRSPNAWRNPLSCITLVVPGESRDDPERGPQSARHKPWTSGRTSPAHFDWVPLDKSLQWHAFQRVVTRLRQRGCDVLVIVGPFNEPMVAPDERGTYRGLREGIAAWLRAGGVACVVPETLPSELYADASHPLTEGYALLARQISKDAVFREWLSESREGERGRNAE
ncbi:MAG: hypothetical protein ABSG68_09445 [Thermoguttaceae bacterium]|jgi:hypothetical protein